MYKLFAIMLLGLIWTLPLTAAQSHSGAHDTEIHAGNETNRNLALVGGGLLGVLLASGAVNLISAGAMMAEGTGFAEAMEAGAGLSMPLTLLTAVLGVIFGQDFVLGQINAYQAGGHQSSAH